MPVPPDQKPLTGPQGLARRVLKLIVQADASRSPFGRAHAALVLIGLLAGFALLGYGVAMLVSSYGRRP